MGSESKDHTAHSCLSPILSACTMADHEAELRPQGEERSIDSKRVEFPRNPKQRSRRRARRLMNVGVTFRGSNKTPKGLRVILIDVLQMPEPMLVTRGIKSTSRKPRVYIKIRVFLRKTGSLPPDFLPEYSEKSTWTTLMSRKSM